MNSTRQEMLSFFRESRLRLLKQLENSQFWIQKWRIRKLFWMLGIRKTQSLRLQKQQPQMDLLRSLKHNQLFKLMLLALRQLMVHILPPSKTEMISKNWLMMLRLSEKRQNTMRWRKRETKNSMTLINFRWINYNKSMTFKLMLTSGRMKDLLLLKMMTWNHS